MTNRQQDLVRELKQNEHIIHVISSEDLQKEYFESKANVKFTAQQIAPALDIVKAGKLIAEVGGFKPNQLVLKKYGNKQYIIFKGRAGERRVLKGTKYLVDTPTVVRMAVGPKGIVKSAKGGFVITAVLSVGIEIFDYVIRDTALLSELLGIVTTDLIKIGLSSIAGAAAGLLVGSIATIGTVAAAPFIAAIAVGVITGLVLDEIDERLGATQALIRAYTKMGLRLDEIKYETSRTINHLENNPQFIPCLFAPCFGVTGY